MLYTAVVLCCVLCVYNFIPIPLIDALCSTLLHFLSVKRACQSSPDKMACHAKKCTFLLGSVAVLADMEHAMSTMHLDVTLGKHPPLDEVSQR